MSTDWTCCESVGRSSSTHVGPAWLWDDQGRPWKLSQRWGAGYCWFLVLVTNSTRVFCAMCSCQFFGRWWLENVKPNQSRSRGRHRRIGKIKVWFLIGGLISTSWTFQVTSGYIVGRFFLNQDGFMKTDRWYVGCKSHSWTQSVTRPFVNQSSILWEWIQVVIPTSPSKMRTILHYKKDCYVLCQNLRTHLPLWRLWCGWKLFERLVGSPCVQSSTSLTSLSVSKTRAASAKASISSIQPGQ